MSNLTDDQKRALDEPIAGVSGKSFIGNLVVDNAKKPVRNAESTGILANFAGRKLVRIDWLSKSDPLVAIFYERFGNWEFLDKTAYEKNTENPVWKDRLFIPYGVDGLTADTKLRFVVYDVDAAEVLNDKDIIGYAETTGRELETGYERTFALVSDTQKMQRKIDRAGSALVVGVEKIAPKPVERDIWDGKVTAFRVRRVRQQVVPYIRRVKVACVTRKVVPHTYQKRVRTKKLVEVQGYEDREEKYTVYKDVTMYKNNTTWRQEDVPEEYTEVVKEEKTRMVRKPYIEIEEEDNFEIVDIPGTKVVDVPGFRVDQVEDRKLVEVTTWDYYELIPHMNRKLVAGQTFIRKLDNFEGSRTVGSAVYTAADEQELRRTMNDYHTITTEHGQVQYSSAPLYSDNVMLKSGNVLSQSERERLSSQNISSSSSSSSSWSSTTTTSSSGNSGYTTTTTTTTAPVATDDWVSQTRQAMTEEF